MVTRRIVWAILLTAILIMAMLAWVLARMNNVEVSLTLLRSFTSPLHAVVAVAIFLLASTYVGRKGTGRVSVFFTSRYSHGVLGIYLVHPLFLLLGTKAGLFPFKDKAWLWIPLGGLAVFLISFALTLVLQKIPIVRRIVA